jgi:hypothetical protein
MPFSVLYNIYQKQGLTILWNHPIFDTQHLLLLMLRFILCAIAFFKSLNFAICKAIAIPNLCELPTLLSQGVSVRFRFHRQ